DGPEQTPLITIQDPDKKDSAMDADQKKKQEEPDKLINNMNGKAVANGIQSHSSGEKQSANDTCRIQTKDGLTICAPDHLEVLTTYVLLEQEEWFEPEL